MYSWPHRNALVLLNLETNVYGMYLIQYSGQLDIFQSNYKINKFIGHCNGF